MATDDEEDDDADDDNDAGDGDEDDYVFFLFSFDPAGTIVQDAGNPYPRIPNPFILEVASDRKPQDHQRIKILRPAPMISSS